MKDSADPPSNRGKMGESAPASLGRIVFAGEAPAEKCAEALRRSLSARTPSTLP